MPSLIDRYAEVSPAGAHASRVDEDPLGDTLADLESVTPRRSKPIHVLH